VLALRLAQVKETIRIQSLAASKPQALIKHQ